MMYRRIGRIISSLSFFIQKISATTIVIFNSKSTATTVIYINIGIPSAATIALFF
jgi:hypothetical protein